MASKLRSVIRHIEPKVAGPFKRLIGTTDFKGQGTKHEVNDVDPVMLCDDSGMIAGKDLPKFGRHPHYGLIAITYILEGKFSDWDCLNGFSDHFNEKDGIYAVSTGGGVVHMEKTESEGNNRAIQTIVKIPLELLAKHQTPEICKASAADIPVLKLDGGCARILVGKMADVQSPVKLSTLPTFVMSRVIVEPKKSVIVPINTEYVHGYAYMLEGKCKLGAEKMEGVTGETGLFLIGEGEGFTVDNQDGDKEAHVLVVGGKPLNEPWVKLLGRNGFLIAETETIADKVMAKMMEKENDFNFKDNGLN